VNKAKLWTGLLALFLSGVLIGAAGVWILTEQKATDPGTRGKGRAPEVIVERLTRELNLNENQQKRITEIVCEAQEEVTQLRRRMRPEMDRIIQESRERMKAELTAGQQERLDELFERLEERRAKRDPGVRSGHRSMGPCQ